MTSFRSLRDRPFLTALLAAGSLGCELAVPSGETVPEEAPAGQVAYRFTERPPGPGDEPMGPDGLDGEGPGGAEHDQPPGQPGGRPSEPGSTPGGAGPHEPGGPAGEPGLGLDGDNHGAAGPAEQTDGGDGEADGSAAGLDPSDLPEDSPEGLPAMDGADSGHAGEAPTGDLDSADGTSDANGDGNEPGVGESAGSADPGGADGTDAQSEDLPPAIPESPAQGLPGAGDGPADTGGDQEDGLGGDPGETGWTPTCADPGVVTTETPICDGSGTTCNVAVFECTRTAMALACEIGSQPAYTETVSGTKRVITANGVPSHDVGPFPNSGNPNAISAQSYTFEVPVSPSGTGSTNVKYFGILKTGVVLDPGTAETWNDDPTWRYEALRYGTATTYFSSHGGTDTNFHPDGLGLDCNLAHVQPTGAYHYHGVPTSLVPAEPDVRFIGWAADGYPIVALYGHTVASDPGSPVREMMASWQMKTGARPSGDEGPGGMYDGTFGADWQYVANSGDLDACNGRTGAYEDASGKTVVGYHYVLTRTFPYIPRCTTKAADATFSAGGGGGAPTGTTGGAAPGGATPGSAAPGGSAPSGAAPGGAAPGGSAPSGSAPGGSAPGGSAPGGAMPGGSAPGSGSGGAQPGGTGGALPTCAPGQTKCCGDGVCDGPETATTCAADCQ